MIAFPVEPSGEVPRDLRMGILWGPAEEALFVERVQARLAAFPWIADDPAELEQVRLSSLWSVDAEVTKSVLLAKIREGVRLEPQDRGPFLDRVRNTLGHEMAEGIRVYARDGRIRQAALKVAP